MRVGPRGGLLRTGNPGNRGGYARRRPTLTQRFCAKVRLTDGCWEWAGEKSHLGYGKLWRPNGLSRQAHRIAYELFVGDVPKGLVLDHICRNRVCVNPAHLEPVTQGENLRRGNTHHMRKGWKWQA